jgi:FixJ family two-component response regulator
MPRTMSAALEETLPPYPNPGPHAADEPTGASATMSHKILFVDDEPAVLDGYRRMLHRDFEIDIATSGAQGLALLQRQGPYAVLLSDMRMPAMTGAELLAEARLQAPETVRMLLTGYAEIDAAIQAINQGHVLRFLTKPCDKQTLTDAIHAGVAQYDLLRAEKELLEKTLMGSIKVLSEVLGAASPEAFGRSLRIARYVRHIVGKFVFPAPWRLEVAASLSQLGCLTLDSNLLRRAYEGAVLTTEEQSRYNAHPHVAMELLASIPRLEPTAWIIGQQLTPALPDQPPPTVLAANGHTASALAADARTTNVSDADSLDSDTLVRGACILKLAVAFDDLRTQGVSRVNALARLRMRESEFSRDLLHALDDLEPERARNELRRLSIAHLSPGMILAQEIRNHLGMLIVANGQEVTRPLITKLENFLQAGMIDKEVSVLVPM